MHIDLSGTDVAASRHGDDGLAEARKKRAQHRSGGPHLNDEVVGGLPRVDVGGIDFQLMLVDDLDGRAEILEHLAHYVDIGDVGDVGEGAHALGHKRSGHKLKR